MYYIVINQRKVLLFEITVEHGELSFLGVPVCEQVQVFMLHKGYCLCSED